MSKRMLSVALVFFSIGTHRISYGDAIVPVCEWPVEVLPADETRAWLLVSNITPPDQEPVSLFCCREHGVPIEIPAWDTLALGPWARELYCWTDVPECTGAYAAEVQ